MKVLEIIGATRSDCLRFNLEGALEQRLDPRRMLEPFFEVLEQYAGDWMPDVVSGKRRRKYSRDAIWKALEEQRGKRGTNVWFYRTRRPALEMSLHLWFPPLAPELDLTVAVDPISFFADTERCRQFVEMVRIWASRYPVSYASARSADDWELSDFQGEGHGGQIRDGDGPDNIHDVWWLNIFGPHLVKAVGRERMLSTPAWRVEELPNGSILIVLRPTAADFASDEARLAQARAHVHLRPDLDFDTVLRALRGRSALLTPVEPRFQPDVAPVLSRVVGNTASYKRQRQIAEFNAYRPPEPEEWRPASAVLPPDVEDVARARERYDVLAERLVALLHTQVPSVFEATPESLGDVDYQFWHEDFPRVFEREHIDAHAVPAIGAYLGEVLVRHLGGQWIPRQKLEEAQVLVGPRVWFPFVRARCFMRSRQAHLDFSLTQLYRVAERHRG